MTDLEHSERLCIAAPDMERMLLAIYRLASDCHPAKGGAMWQIQKWAREMLERTESTP